MLQLPCYNGMSHHPMQVFILIHVTQSHSPAEMLASSVATHLLFGLQGLILSISSDMPGHIKVLQQCKGTAAHVCSDVYTTAGLLCCPC